VGWIGRHPSADSPNVKTNPLAQKYQTTAPGAPDGEYVIIQFSTTFENKKESTETLTLMMDKDRGWRTAGYFVK